MAKVSVQFCNFSTTVGNSRPAVMLPLTLSDRVEVDVTATATAGASRPENPDAAIYTHALCIPLDGQVLVEVGQDPSADQSSRLLPLSGLEYAVHVGSGQRLSFVTRSTS